MSVAVKFAVVGLGHIGLRHVAMIERNPESELVAVCDIRKGTETGFENPAIPYYSSVEELLAHTDADVINICTPNGLHAQMGLQVLASHKHVVLEKPLALTRRDAEKVIFKALQMSRQVFAVMQNRYSPPARWLKQMISEQRLGRIFMVQLNCYWNRDERYYKPGGWHGTANLDGGVLFTQFSHFIDIMYWLFGDIENIKGNFGNFAHHQSTPFEDAGTVIFDFVNGGMGTINYSTAVWDKNMESSITIIGEKGSVKVAGQYMDKVAYCHVKDYVPEPLEEALPANDYGGYKGSASNHGAVIENVVKTLKGEMHVATNALEGMKVVDIIERIYSVRGDGALTIRESL